MPNWQKNLIGLIVAIACLSVFVALVRWVGFQASWAMAGGMVMTALLAGLMLFYRLARPCQRLGGAADRDIQSGRGRGARCAPAGSGARREHAEIIVCAVASTVWAAILLAYPIHVGDKMGRSRGTYTVGSIALIYLIGLIVVAVSWYRLIAMIRKSRHARKGDGDQSDRMDSGASGGASC
jgi:hypothetical protein